MGCKITEGKLSGIKILEPQIHRDERGYFFESYNEQEFHSETGPVHFVQDNQSYSKKNVLRGLHYQLNPHQDKLVRVIKGEIFDVVVDIRPESSTYKQWESFILNSETSKSLWVPSGFAHGFLVLSEYAVVFYKTSTYYQPAAERSIKWNSPEFNIPWPIKEPPILSLRDSQAPIYI